VQGVGFRPFVFRLAAGMGLNGWVSNSPQGACLEVEGAGSQLNEFLLRLEREKPLRSFIHGLESSRLDRRGYRGFEIRPSVATGEKTALVLPDLATCPDCLREIFDPRDRRHFYPFTNCTQCGPRFSIIEGLPYDRARTSMKRFKMCPECQAEFNDPGDRRFHAQPNACPACGPSLQYWDADGRVIALVSHDALTTAARALRDGQIVAVKGLGGFHLMVDADNEPAVRRLRERKHREEKPLALMVPSLAVARDSCQVSPLEERVLCSPEAPIVLLTRREDHSERASQSRIAPSVAPRNPRLGVMLPSTPLHHLLLSLFGGPVVATSGNLRDEPICIDEQEALERLRGIADGFLVHDRPIVRHVDDSIVRVLLDREQVFRRARGFAPLPVMLEPAEAGGTDLRAVGPTSGPGQDLAASAPAVLAVGAHLKNTVALALGPQVFVSQHIGDLETGPALAAFHRVVEDFESLYGTKPAVVAADAHPDYLSTRFALETGLPVVRVQHHYAHVLSCMAENELAPPVLGVAWDGTGYGTDGTVWGGEFLQVNATGFERIACFRPFPLPGGEAAVREPRRVALGLLYAMCGDEAFELNHLLPLQAFLPTELSALRQMLARGLNSPLTSSAGRLFDAVASLLGLRQWTGFEGQAALELEFAAETVETNECYPSGMPPVEGDPGGGTRPLLIDWEPMIRGILDDLERGTPASEIAARFHNTLAEVIVDVARIAGTARVTLSGGCFQNALLTGHAVRRLQAGGFRPGWHQRIPPNDGGIALGQVVAARRAFR
jgi:hydrogenase maturation protein HypF